jgi:hypothetical protein
MALIRGEGLIPRGFAAVIKELNPSPTPQENNIPQGSAPGLLIVPGCEQNEKDGGKAVYDRGGGKLSWRLGRPKRAPSDGRQA